MTIFQFGRTGTLTLESLHANFVDDEGVAKLSTYTTEGLLDTLRDLVPSSIDLIGEQLRKLSGLGTSQRLPERTHVDIQRFLQHIEAIDYARLRKMNVQIPAGLKGEYLPFLKNWLVPVASHMELVLFKELQKFRTSVAKGVNRPEEFLKSIQNASVDNKFITKYKENLPSFINDRNNVSNNVYSKVYSRNREWKDILGNETQLARSINGIKMDEMLKEAQKINQDLLTINQWLTANYEKQHISPKAVEALGKQAFYLASSMELLSVLLYLGTASYNCTTNNMTAIATI